MNLDDLLNEMSEKMRNRDLSDEYLREHNNFTREEIGIGEYAYGITMIPCKWVYEYLSDYKSLQKENEELKEIYRSEKKMKNEYIKLYQDLLLKENVIPVQKIKDKIERIQEEGYWLFTTDRDSDKCVEILQELLGGNNE